MFKMRSNVPFGKKKNEIFKKRSNASIGKKNEKYTQCAVIRQSEMV